MKKYCKHCKTRTEFKELGFKNYNRRLECKKCFSLRIPLSTRLFGHYISPKFIDIKDLKKWSYY